MALMARFLEQDISLWFTNITFGNPSNLEYSIPQLRIMIREVENIIDREITADE